MSAELYALTSGKEMQKEVPGVPEVKKGDLVCPAKECQWRKPFNSHLLLKRHIEKTHVGVTKFKCEECKRYFVNKFNLTTHNNTTHGTKIPCTDCEKTFSSKSNLKLHIRRKHSPKVKLTCEFCPQTFVDKYYLSEHLSLCKGKGNDQQRLQSCPYEDCDKELVAKALHRHMKKVHGWAG